MLEFSYWKLIKKMFLRSLWLKLMPVYCFFGFLMTHSEKSRWVEEEIFRATSSFVLTISVVPVILLIMILVSQLFRNSNLLVRIGRKQYYRRLLKLIFSAVLIFVLYYSVGVYLLANFLFSENGWKDPSHNILAWLMEVLLLLMFLCFVSLLFMTSRIKWNSSAPGILITLILAYGFWKKTELYGSNIADLLLVAGLLLISVIAIETAVKKYDFKDWR